MSVKQKKENLPVLEIASGNNSGFETPTMKVISTMEDLSQTWEIAYKNYLKKKEFPAVDLEEFDVILVALGERNSGGYSIQVESAVSIGNAVTVTVIETKPGSNCMTTEAITYPFQLVQIPKTGKTISFEKTEKVIHCKSK
ncbi:MAG: protease complex subunit PrcB family protein [Flavobacteriales bacterium]|nr:protease complex subunit PrcB family protein [Flavobacteriales bacterium]